MVFSLASARMGTMGLANSAKVGNKITMNIRHVDDLVYGFKLGNEKVRSNREKGPGYCSMSKKLLGIQKFSLGCLIKILKKCTIHRPTL